MKILGNVVREGRGEGEGGSLLAQAPLIKKYRRKGLNTEMRRGVKNEVFLYLYSVFIFI